jgi:deoxyribodipyrimidine photo-lyase
MIQEERIRRLGGGTSRRGDYVLYWMQASQREDTNHALEFAVERANDLNLPVLVYFGLTPDYPEANLRHYVFMLEGLAEVRKALAERGIGMVVRSGPPDAGAVRLSRRAALLVTDRGYVRVERAWRARVAERASCPVFQVETNAVVPVETASSKEEYMAATLRPKIRRLLPKFLVPLKRRAVRRKRANWDIPTISLPEPGHVPARFPRDRSVEPTRAYAGGTSRAREWLDRFVADDLARYHKERNDVGRDRGSRLSPYLHFGQVSPLAVALAAGAVRGPGTAAFLEQLIVRRELSLNFVFYNAGYDDFSCLPDWCRRTLAEHARDKREASYPLEALEAGRTHDPYWNAAQKEMVCLGRMHNVLRMYWGKKLLEWHRRPREAFRRALHLNNKYELDGRGPNAFAGVAWCFGKHDRPWPERPAFGKVRSMTAAGLDRKYDMARYVRRVDQACAALEIRRPKNPERR